MDARHALIWSGQVGNFKNFGKAYSTDTMAVSSFGLTGLKNV
jgi:hypothetical protein